MSDGFNNLREGNVNILARDYQYVTMFTGPFSAVISLLTLHSQDQSNEVTYRKAIK